MTEIKGLEKNGSGLNQLLNHSIQIIDDWDKRENSREDVLLQFIKQLAENVKQNQTNLNKLIIRFVKELFEWEEISREELLSSTASLNNLFLFQSYEEINNQVDQIKKQSSEVLTGLLNNLLKSEYPDTIKSTLEKYIENRRNNRELYVKNANQMFSIIQTSQKTFFNFVTNPFKNSFLSY
ncbi:hypothetical protein [Neobacillus niacini]|uniref:hypothetical protein n=1 Tax=Neobacillus niacini TaxID=86668 RepID=UPI002854B5C8|nr:hypothetical protein [Neobacillus niacini]MDR6998350.1 putative PurR-regulated permease PerM [Neobacillus niacini]